jgi:hypothetical protein
MVRTMNKTVTYQKYFDGNETSKEGRNGRIYSGTVGWRYAALIDGRLTDDEPFERLCDLKSKYPNAKPEGSVR